MEPEVADHRSAEQWRFFVLPERELPKQKTLSINRLRSLADETSYGGLSDVVSAKLSQLGDLKVKLELKQGLYIRTSRFDNKRPGDQASNN